MFNSFPFISRSDSHVLKDVNGNIYCSFSGQCLEGSEVISSKLNTSRGECGCDYVLYCNQDKSVKYLIHEKHCRYYYRNGIILAKVKK
jgi:hypothetical protein